MLPSVTGELIITYGHSGADKREFIGIEYPGFLFGHMTSVVSSAI